MLRVQLGVDRLADSHRKQEVVMWSSTPVAMTELLFQPVQVGRYELVHRVVMAPLTRSRTRQPGDVPVAPVSC